MAHQSDSTVQLDAQSLISKEIEAIVGKDLTERIVELDRGARVRIDGVDADESVFRRDLRPPGAGQGRAVWTRGDSAVGLR